MDAMGSIAIRRGIMNFTGYPFDSSGWSFCFSHKEYGRTLSVQKNYYSANDFIKKALASINICSRFRGEAAIRATVSTPAMLENNS